MGWVKYNANPKRMNVGDCTVRAIANGANIAIPAGGTVGFSGFLELPVVVGTRTGSVLNIVLKVLKVNHFVKQGSTGFFKGAVQVFGAQVDFVIAAFIFQYFRSLMCLFLQPLKRKNKKVSFNPQMGLTSDKGCDTMMVS